MNNKFSLIMATYGRKKEVEAFLKNLLDAEYELNDIEIIIVDQNEEIKLDDIVFLYNEKLNIKHIKSNKKGLAINRNIGLEVATGDIIAFPDDDCEYLKDTLKNVNKLFEENNFDCVMGRIIERDESDSLRVWPKYNIKITKNNYYKRCSSVTMFYNKNSSILKFNDNLGAGRYFGSCEDTDILYNNLKNKKNVQYNPIIRIYHPHYDSKTSMSNEKIASYGRGFGAFVKSNKDIYVLFLFLQIEIYHLLKFMYYFIKFDKVNYKKSLIAFKSRIKGFLEYKN